MLGHSQQVHALVIIAPSHSTCSSQDNNELILWVFLCQRKIKIGYKMGKMDTAVTVMCAHVDPVCCSI